MRVLKSFKPFNDIDHVSNDLILKQVFQYKSIYNVMLNDLKILNKCLRFV